MSPPPRRLTFAVGTSLLTASLSLGAAGCDEPKGSDKTEKQTPEPEETVNVVAPEEPVPEPVHVNEGPEPAPEVEEKVNTGPEPEPKPEPVVNVVDSPPAEPVPEPAPEKHVNTRAPDK